MANYPLFIGLRYSFSRKRNRFTAIIAAVSLLGMVIGVASLITVLSVMNGFSGELRSRILALVPHGFVTADNGQLSQWPQLATELQNQPGVVAVAPYIDSKVILSANGVLRGVRLQAIDPEREVGVSNVGESLVVGELSALDEERWGIVLGTVLARWLGVRPGDSVEMTIPRLTVTPLGAFPRSRRFTVVGLFEVGANLDGEYAYISLPAGQRLFGLGTAVQGLQVKTTDLFSAPSLLASLRATLPEGLRTQDWSETQGNLFRAVRMEKIMVGLLLLSVVAVAAFNIISTLAMSVTEKRGDIAVLRTLGASAGGVMSIFVIHGLALAVAGVGLGVVFGVLLAINVADVVAFLEELIGVKMFDPSVYFISRLPADLQWPDVAVVAVAAIALSLLATLYPAWRAARVDPSEVLRYE